MMTRSRVFLLSPAHCGGKRAAMLLREQARFDLAIRLRSGQGAALGEVFSFLSGLYFRGKLAYARRFARPPEQCPGALVITTNRGLLPADTRITLDDLRQMGGIDIDPSDPRYRTPLSQSLSDLRCRAGGSFHAVLLGSVATGKYVDILLSELGDQLHFPLDFVGRGDMSRGGLMLRCVEESRELVYAPIEGATRNGQRPPRLQKRAAVT
jgi:hypothetical protein